MYLSEIKKFDLKTLEQIVKKKTLHKTICLSDVTAKKAFKRFKKMFTIVKAAGGLVLDEENKGLFIFRKQRWDLPKGKIELGEKRKKAAQREVEEECGIKVASMDKLITQTYHMYSQNGILMLKKTYWYKMHATSKQALKPQVEEGISRVEWMDQTQLENPRLKTFPSIKEVLKYW